MELLQYLSANFNVSAEAQQLLSEHLQVQKIPRNTILLAENQVSEYIYFVQKGLVRAFYYNENGEDITTLFADAGDFIYSPASFQKQEPSTDTIQVLEPSEIVAISHRLLTKLYDNHLEINTIGRILNEKYLVMYDERVRALRTTNPNIRIQHFMTTYPEIFNRVAKTQLASYLGTTRETLSRFLSAKRKHNL
jgi:CRP/FNR family transcriptional regulator, anaerobic regulatory protein